LPGIRWLREIIRRRLSPAAKILGRDGRKALRDRALPQIERDWTAVPAMGCWFADHRQFDVLIPTRIWSAHKGKEVWAWLRPWLTLYLDARSWMPVGWTILFDSPDGDRTMGVFVRAVGEHGQPEVLYIDNGKDFRMSRFAGGRRRAPKPTEKIVAEATIKPLVETLGVSCIFALPYNARAKVLEPFFKILSERFDKTWETYCGRSPEHKPESVKALRGRAAEHHAAGLCLEAFSQAFNRWVTEAYSVLKSPCLAARGLSPAQAFVDLRRKNFVAVRPSQERLALLLMPSVPVRVTQNGVWVRPFMAHYWSAELEDRRGASARDVARSVRYRYDPGDPSAVWVFDGLTDRFLAKATPYQGAGINPLAVVNGDQADRDRLTDALVLQRELAKRYTTQVDHLRDGSNLRLELAVLAARRKRELPPGPSAPVPPVLVKMAEGGGDADRAALAVAEHRQRRAKQPRKTAGEMLTDFYAATGTDPSAQRSSTLRLRPEGLSTGGGSTAPVPNMSGCGDAAAFPGALDMGDARLSPPPPSRREPLGRMTALDLLTGTEPANDPPPNTDGPLKKTTDGIGETHVPSDIPDAG
jgi:hypothetical protein